MCLAFSKSANTVAPSLPKPQTYRLECFLEAQLLDILDLLCISRGEEDLDAYIGSDLVGPRELQNGPCQLRLPSEVYFRVYSVCRYTFWTASATS